MDLVKRVEQFLKERWDRKSPLLVAYSGGPDSKALLYALLKAGISRSSLHIAHVDHGWRTESEAEAALIAEEISALQLPFYSIRLGERPKSNWEDFGRRARLKFFRALFEKISFGALLLAHHADDGAETVLKRVFEGAHLVNLGGIKRRGAIDGMEIWRPLMGVCKRDISGFLQEMGLQSIGDPTNEEVRFLRGRLRKEILPFLEQSFGKGIVSNLGLLSERCVELKEYLDRKIEPIWERRLEGPWGICIALDRVERVEARHALQAMAAKEGLVVPRALLEFWLDVLEKKRVGVQLNGAGRILYADRGRAFVLSRKRPQFEGAIALKAGRFVLGDWVVEICPYEGGRWGQEREKGWEEIWQGAFEVLLPDGILQLYKERKDKAAQEAWRRANVPPFFRREMPVVLSGKKIYEFISGKGLCEAQLGWTVRFFLDITR